jgi:cytochrome P450
MTDKEMPSPPLDKFWGKITGHALNLSKDRLGFMMKSLENYGEFVKLKMGKQTNILLSSPEGIDYVLRKNAKNYSKDTPGFNLVSEMAGKGVFTESGKSWLEKRKKVNPFFSSRNKVHWLPHITKSCNELVEIIDKTGTDSLNICPLMTRTTLQILGRTIFNQDMGQYGEIFEKELSNLIHITDAKFTQILPFPTPTKIRQKKSFERSTQIIEKIISDMIDSAKELPMEPDKNMIHAFLTRAAAGNDFEKSHRYLVDQIKTMAFAGHETSSNVLTWSLYLILKHDEWHKKIKEEVITLLGKREITLEDFDKLPLLTMAINESMRLYPPAWSIGRRAEDDDVICGYKIEKGDVFMISPYLTQHNEKYFENPELFDPTRFNEENIKKIPAGAYLPFGLGPRSCIGEGLAMMEIIAIIAVLFQTYEMSIDNSVQVEMLQKITLQPKNGINIFFKRF